MLFVDETKKIIDIMLLKGKAQQMSVGEALVFWYKASLIPVMVAAMVTGILIAVGSTVVLGGWLGILFGVEVFGSLGAAALVIVGIFISVWIFTPGLILISAAILHFFGKILLKQFKNGYAATLTASVYVSLISMLFLFIGEVPVVVWIIGIGIIGMIWSFIALVVWLARFQNTTWMMSLDTIMGEVIVITIIVFVVAVTSFWVGPTLLPTVCIAQAGFLCKVHSFITPYANAGTLNVTIGHATGTNWVTANIAFLNNSQSSAPKTASYWGVGNIIPYPSGISSGGEETMLLPVNSLRSNAIGTSVSGQIWAEYTNSSGGPEYYTEIATVTAKSVG